jgi:hypothetical protein
MKTEILAVRDTNTEFVLRDKEGNIKQLFQPNVLGNLTGLRIPFVTGTYQDSYKRHNLVTNVGHQGCASRLSNQGSFSPFVNIAIGTGTTAAAVTNTALQTEITTGGGARKAATASLTTTNVSNDTVSLTAAFTFSSSFAVTEEGILDNAVSGGNLLAHQVFSPLSVASGDSLTVTHTVVC